ncbi:MAG: hypothetical protein ACOYVJ_12960 [Nitrospirota bacterium]
MVKRVAGSGNSGTKGKVVIVVFVRGTSLYRIIPGILFLCILTLTSSAFAFDSPLRTEPASPSELKGTFSLLLYGGRFADDIETVVIFVPEGGDYTFVLYAPDFDYKTEKGRPAREALERAEKFVSFHHAFWRSWLSRILDPDGTVIGYELRPLYRPFVYGSSDVLEVHYWPKKDTTIKVTIRLKPSVERKHFPGDLYDSPPGD